MRTIDLMTPDELQGLRDAGRGHLIDGMEPCYERADTLRKQEREDAAQATVRPDKARSEGDEWCGL